MKRRARGKHKGAPADSAAEIDNLISDQSIEKDIDGIEERSVFDTYLSDCFHAGMSTVSLPFSFSWPIPLRRAALLVLFSFQNLSAGSFLPPGPLRAVVARLFLANVNDFGWILA